MPIERIWLQEHDRKVREQARAEARAEAIDEFVEALKDSLANNYRHLLTIDADGFEWLTTDAVHTHIDEIAEQLKAGGKHD
jgi:hypothetical protein